MCLPGTNTSFVARDSKMRFGAQRPTWTGQTRWLIWAACWSIDPCWANKQWAPAMSRGLDMVFGYRGTSADSHLTDEALADFAAEAYNHNSFLKAACMWAARNWWVGDTPGLIASGS